MTGSQAVAPPSAQKMQFRQAGLRRASLAILIVLIVLIVLGVSVNLYVTLPAVGHPGHASWFGNGPLLALHAALGMFLSTLSYRVHLHRHTGPDQRGSRSVIGFAKVGVGRSWR